MKPCSTFLPTTAHVTLSLALLACSSASTSDSASTEDAVVAGDVRHATFVEPSQPTLGAGSLQGGGSSAALETGEPGQLGGPFQSIPNDGFLLLRPSDRPYRYHFGIKSSTGSEWTDGIEFVVGRSHVTLDAADTTERLVLRVHAPRRTLPSFACTSDWGADEYHFVAYKGSNEFGERTIALRSDAFLDLGIAKWQPTVRYALTLPGVSLYAQRPFPVLDWDQLGEGPIRINIGRIDVPDVASPSGPIHALFNVFDMDGMRVNYCEQPTGTGVDVPEGRYRVIVHSTASPIDKLAQYEVEIR